jgi:hypothetical protein
LGTAGSIAYGSSKSKEVATSEKAQLPDKFGNSTTGRSPRNHPSWEPSDEYSEKIIGTIR